MLVCPRDVVPPRRIAIAWKDARGPPSCAGCIAVPAASRKRHGRRSVGRGDGAQALQGARTSPAISADIASRSSLSGWPADVTAANSLLRLIEDENIGLVVAGAYGHSRLGEWMFGGVTRDLLGESRICCLFSN